MSVRFIILVVSGIALLLVGVAFASNGGLSDQHQIPVVGFGHSGYTVDETAGEVSIPVTINESPTADEEVVVTFRTLAGTATEERDYLEATGSITFTNTSDLTQFFAVTIIDDDILAETDETVNLSLTLETPDTARLGRGAATLIIVDDDLPPPSPPGPPDPDPTNTSEPPEDTPGPSPTATIEITDTPPPPP